MMVELPYLIYLLSFILGLVIGLLLSYKKYNEAFIINKIDIISLIIASVGWIFLLNYRLFPFILPEITISISVFLIALVLGMRPGYGRKETGIGIAISAFIGIINYLLI